MESYSNPPLLMLMGMKYNATRKRCETLWNQQTAINMSASEWYVLFCIAGKQPTISEIARQADISRQASHKYIHTLLEKGLIQNADATEGRGKRVTLTPLGLQCLEQYLQLQQQLEEDIATSLGTTPIHELKAILQKNWFE